MSTLPTDRRPPGSGTAAVAEYIEKLVANAAPAPRTGRLIFALDATASREPVWDQACHITGEMFEATASIGGIDVKLVYYRGYGECKAGPWLGSAANLHRLMRSVSCVGGYTQIHRVLGLALDETAKAKLGAVIFVGDMVEEKVDQLCHLAGELGRKGVPIFVFHEGSDPVAGACFKQLASLSKGVYLPFDLASISHLRELLGGIAVFVSGGFQALQDLAAKKGGELLRLTAQLKR